MEFLNTIYMMFTKDDCLSSKNADLFSVRPFKFIKIKSYRVNVENIVSS